jgi:excisionase family DNA binding protein
MGEKFWTIQEVADWLKLSRDTIEKAIKEGKLSAYRPGGGRTYRISQSALEAWVNMPAS